MERQPTCAGRALGDGLVLALAGLSFLGVGLQPPTPDWGILIQDARPCLRSAPHLVLGPIVCVLSLALGANLLADALLDRAHLSGWRAAPPHPKHHYPWRCS